MLLAALRFATGKCIYIHLEQWSATRLELAFHQRQRQVEPPAQATAEYQLDTASLDDDRAMQPVVQFINQTLRIAIHRRVSDVHFV